MLFGKGSRPEIKNRAVLLFHCLLRLDDGNERRLLL
jgi:hypothetical protein